MTNKLKIQANQLHLELTGDSEAIALSYSMTRELLIRSFQEQFIKIEEERRRSAQVAKKPVVTPPPAPDFSKVKAPKPFSLEEWTPPEHMEATHISVVFTASFYHKVCSLERGEFQRSPFGDIFQFEKIGRVYLQHTQQENFKPYFNVGKVLWRELTPEGFAAVRHEQ